MYEEKEKPAPAGKDSPGDGESVDVYEETFGAAADEAFEAVKRGDSSGFRTALKEAIKNCK